MIVYTIGHSTRSFADLLALLQREQIARLVDIRTFPGSRKYPQFNRDELARALAQHGIRYEHVPGLGGRRRLPAGAPPSGWRNESFRAYAAHMHTTEFREALEHLMEAARGERVAIMCSEAVPWRCHRNLVSDALVARGVDVRHILDGRTSPHTLTSFAVVRQGNVEYPAAEDASAADAAT